MASKKTERRLALSPLQSGRRSRRTLVQRLWRLIGRRQRPSNR